MLGDLRVRRCAVALAAPLILDATDPPQVQ
jgi:hypothetical protein